MLCGAAHEARPDADTGHHGEQDDRPRVAHRVRQDRALLPRQPRWRSDPKLVEHQKCRAAEHDQEEEHAHVHSANTDEAKYVSEG